jgi:hypothetical protein
MGLIPKAMAVEGHQRGVTAGNQPAGLYSTYKNYRCHLTF